MCRPQIQADQCAAISREHMIVIIWNRSRESDTALLEKNRPACLRACLNSCALTSGDDANGGANDGGGGASPLRSSSPSSLPGSPWRRRDWPTTAPGPAAPERQGPVPHQLQRVPELSSSSLKSPFGDPMPCQRHAAESNQPLTAAQIASRVGATSIRVIICAGVINARPAIGFRGLTEDFQPL